MKIIQIMIVQFQVLWILYIKIAFILYDIASEIDMYLLEPQINHNLHPLLWWITHADKYKRLAELAKMYLRG